MNSSIQQRVLEATRACLRPLARVLLRSGINFRQFEEMAKEAFLEEASAERDGRGRRANVSRIAVRTGLSRKEVARIRDRHAATASLSNAGARAGYDSGHAARALQIWHTDARFLASDGTPRDLPLVGDEFSFNFLVRLVGGDIPTGAVRAELRAAGAVVDLESGMLRAVKRYFVPGGIDEDVVVGLTHILYPVVEGLARNTGLLKSDPFVQRFAYSDRLIPSSMPPFRKLAQARCAEFVQSMDDWLSSNEIGGDGLPDEQMRVGVGVFYFEGRPPNAE